MIRGGVLSFLLVALLAAAVMSAKTQKIEITKVSRTTTLSGAYASENIKISFVANDDSIDHFTYLAPIDYDQKIAKIWFTKNERDREALSYAKSHHAHEGQSYAKYVITLPHNYQVGDIGQIVVHIVYLFRYENLPSSIALKEDQKLQYEDIKYIVSPYHIVEHESAYKFARIHEYDPDGVKKGSTEVEFNKNSLEPYTHVKHHVFGVNNNAQVQFTHVEKVIEVSHWGNVGITERYKIVNKGPTLKGQFSRVSFGSKGYDIGNAFHGIDFDLPYQIWGLYYLDEVGNISTSKAYRDHGSNVVRMSMMPRFALLGGWKSNWQIGYNLPTKGHLFHDGNRFELRNVKLEYALERILSEEFVVKVVLPDGAENVKITIEGQTYDQSSLQISRTEGYLDFNGRPTYIIPNYRGSIKDKDIDISYTFASNQVYQKIITLILIVLGLLVSAVFLKRFKLQAFDEKEE